jgi:aminoglycoside 3-N-acetyltransferase
MKSLGQVSGGPVAVIEALIEAVGADRGTIAFACFTKPLDVVDVLRTPCSTGLLAEAFRMFPGVALSQCHTHRVGVYGNDAANIAACHVGTSPLGRSSPLHEIAKRGGSVIHIGCDMRSCSLVHVAEAIFPLPYNHVTWPGYDKPITLICPDGRRIICPPKDNPGDSAGFLKLQEEMDRHGLIRRGRVGPALCLKARGLDILAVAMEMMSRDPAILLCDNPKCPVCPKKRRIAAAIGWRQARRRRRRITPRLAATNSSNPALGSGIGDTSETR